MTGDWASRVDAALEGNADFDELWNLLTEAIDHDPSNAGLRRERMRLAEAAYLRREYAADLQALHELDPSNRDLALKFQMTRWRWAPLLVEDDEAGDDDAPPEGEVDATDDPSDDPANDPADAMRAEAVSELIRLGDRHAADAAFMLQLLEGWDDSVSLEHWERLRLSLQALAHHPQNAALQWRLAQAWHGIARLDPEVELPPGQLPVGFAVDVHGQVTDALAAAQALSTLQACSQGDRPAHEQAQAAALRAGLLQSLCRFDEAALAWQHAAAHIEAQAAAAEGFHLESLQASAAQARADAACCQGGRAAVSLGLVNQVQQAFDKFGQARPVPDGAPSELQTALQGWAEERETSRQELHSEWERLVPQFEQAAAQPDAAQLATIDQQARTIAASVAGSLAFAPAQWHAVDVQGERAAIDPALHALGNELRQLGLPFIGWVENPALSEQLGGRTLLGLWTTPDGQVSVLGAMLRSMVMVDLESELSDGRQVVTTGSRGRNFMHGGERVQMVHTDLSVPLARRLSLHQARVAAMAAATPGLRVRPFVTLDDFRGLQERQRQAKLEFRLSEGLSLEEAHALPVDWPEIFVPRLREAALSRIRAAHADFVTLSTGHRR